MRRTGQVSSVTYRENLLAEVVLAMDDGSRITVTFEQERHRPLPVATGANVFREMAPVRVQVQELPAGFAQDSP